MAVAGCASTQEAPAPKMSGFTICERYVLEGWPVQVCVDANTWYNDILPKTGPGPHQEEHRAPMPGPGADAT